MTEVPQPEDIYRRTKEEGRRRLERPTLEIVSTALAAGFDIVAGIVAFGLVSAQLEPWAGKAAAHVFGSLAFGLSFGFLVVGRGELFTENFLVPIAGLDRRRSASWLALMRLWLTSPLFNVLGGTLVILIVTVHGVLPHGSGRTIAWFVEGQESMLVRFVIAWTVGALIALGDFPLAVAGNVLGGVGLVTLNRLTQGKLGERQRSSA